MIRQCCFRDNILCTTSFDRFYAQKPMTYAQKPISSYFCSLLRVGVKKLLQIIFNYRFLFEIQVSSILSHLFSSFKLDFEFALCGVLETN